MVAPPSRQQSPNSWCANAVEPRVRAPLYLKRGALAQLGERLVCNQEVAGSIPVRSIYSQKAGQLRPTFPVIPARYTELAG